MECTIDTATWDRTWEWRDHNEMIRRITREVRRSGTAGALATMRAARPQLAAGRYHDTLAVFFVWAVDRLATAGLSDRHILWHPLTDVRSPLAWWDSATLAGDDAFAGFVPSTLATAGEPQPAEPTRALVAA